MPLMTGQRVKAAWKNGDIDYGVMTIGQSVGRIYDVPTTAELLERMAYEAKNCLDAARRIF